MREKSKKIKICRSGSTNRVGRERDTGRETDRNGKERKRKVREEKEI